MRRARPTLRCLQEDLDLPVPPVTRLLEDVEHPLLAKASDQFAEANAKHERIRAIDDTSLVQSHEPHRRGRAAG
ncbi:hypothetical protein [Frankia sp. Cppng1_Ct_nod]|uniref:hypothetical protein n=1 Tax=Frankia sp. Cppng1_Ct_nod TaxID=2897162 RepID=UPI001040FAA8|nr:hypothetical protein [Frankia sp. Cppng1_Ct_nod]